MPISDKDRMTIRNFLKEVSIFRNLSEKHLDLISGDFSISKVKKDEPIFLQTDKSTELYIILKGKAVVTLLSDKGEEFILNELKEGDFFGELSLIDGKSRSASVVAAEDSTLAVLGRESFINAIKQEPMIAVELLKTVTKRLRQATDREEQLAFFDVRQRLSKYFTSLIKTEGKKAKSNYMIAKRSQKEIAVRIGSSREAISKVLRDMTNKKEIQEKGEFFLITSKLYNNYIDPSL
jgi:CRP/FNR family transcriptional regulator/CRP/FNR family cyclic AMP-dependent transcriptional regulator